MPHVAAKSKQKLVAATERNQSETRRTQNPQSGQSAITIAVAVAVVVAVAADVAIVSAMIAKSNSPKRCGTKRGNIFYA